MIEALHLAYNAIKANKTRATIAVIILAAIITALVFAAGWLHEQLTIENISYLVKNYGYYLIFGLVMLGNMGVPVPEESPVIIAGLAAQQGWLDYKTAAAVCIVSAIIGDNIGYLVGRKGGRALILRFGQYVGINEEKLKKFEGFFERYGAKTVFIARFIAGLRWVAGPLSGAAKMPFKRFLFYNATGAVVWVTIMTQLGYHFGNQLPRLLKLIGQANASIFIIAVIVIAVVLYLRKRKQQPTNASQQGSGK